MGKWKDHEIKGEKVKQICAAIEAGLKTLPFRPTIGEFAVAFAIYMRLEKNEKKD